MATSFDPRTLSQIITLPTNAPLPVNQINGTGADVEVTEVPHGTEKVHLRVCSEFVKYTAPVTAFENSSKIALVVDSLGQPLVASIGDDKRLWLLFHVDGASIAWQIKDITPGIDTAKVFAFDMQSWGGKVYLAVAAGQSESSSAIYTVSFPVPSLKLQDGAVSPEVTTLLNWRQLLSNLENRSITYISCSPATTPLVKSADYQIIAGTEASGENAGAEYVVDPSENVASPWSILPLPETTWKVLQVAGASTSAGVGFFTLYTSPSGTGCTQTVVDQSGTWMQPLGNIRLLTASLGNVQDMTTNVNPALQTDVFLASDKGIAFFNAVRLTVKPTIILGDISFKQVVAHEDIDPLKPDDQSIITVFAVSRTGDLYVIHGTRLWASNTVTFACSGFPIRQEVARMSGIYNGITGNSELIYAVDNKNELKHLIRDCRTELWTEDSIQVPSLDKTISYPAYMTSIVCTDSSGAPVLEGYPISLTSDATKALIGGKTYSLNAIPTTITTDRTGSVKIVLPCDDNLAAVQLNIAVSKFLPTAQVHQVNPQQRVLAGLASVNNGSDLSQARSAKGDTIFQNVGGDSESQSKVNACGTLLSNTQSLVQQTDTTAATQVYGLDPAKKQDVSFSLEKDENGHFSIGDGNWLKDAATKVIHFVEDVVEWITKKVKTVLRFAFKVLDDVLEFAVEVEGKIIKFVIKTIGFLLKSVVSFLKEHLNIDLTGLLNWLGFIFDVDEIKKTQKVLLDTVHGAINLTDRFLTVNRDVLTDALQTVRSAMRSKMNDSRPSVAEQNSVKSSSNFHLPTGLINNPIIMFLLDHNPFELLLEEAVSSGIIQLPSMEDLNSILMDIVPDLLKDEFAIIERLVKDIYEKIKIVIHDPSKLGETLLDMLEDILWTIFDAGEKIIIAIYDILLKFFKQFIVLCTSTIKIPLLTTAFEVLAEQDFSIVNCGTFVFAAIMNIAYAITHRKLPFDVLPIPSNFSQTIADDHLRLVKTSSSDPTPHSQIKALVATPMVLKSTSLESKHINLVTAAAVPETPTAPPTDSTDTEVENVEAAAHSFALTDLWAGGFATASGVLNADIILVTMGKAIGKNSSKGNTKPEKEVSAIAMIPDIIAYSMALVSRVTDLAVYKASIAKNPALSKELGDDNTRMCGYVAGLVTTLASLGISIANLKFGAQGAKYGAGVVLTMGDMIYQLCTNILPVRDTDKFSVDTASIRMTLVDTTAIAAIVCQSIETPPTEIAAVVLGATSTLFTVGTFGAEASHVLSPSKG